MTDHEIKILDSVAYLPGTNIRITLSSWGNAYEKLGDFESLEMVVYQNCDTTCSTSINFTTINSKGVDELISKLQEVSKLLHKLDARRAEITELKRKEL